MLCQNGVTSSIKPQQITYIVPGVENFDHAEISMFVQRAQENSVGFCLKIVAVMNFLFLFWWFVFFGKEYFFNLVQDSALLEFAWVELLEKNKRVTAEELAEVLYISS